jgi:hypothetical protein
LWVRASLVAALLTLAVWLTTGHLDRVSNEHRLSAIASLIAGRPVHVQCPGLLNLDPSWDGDEGYVDFDAYGHPGDTAHLARSVCSELDALAEGGRADVLRCVACGTPDAVKLALAVDVLSHESFHLRGISDEAVTECHALAEIPRTSVRLGTTLAQGKDLATLDRETNYLDLPPRYRIDCSTLPGL